jgi:hypothetical protein
MDPVTVKLRHPITDFGKPVESVTVSRASTFGDYVDADEAGTGVHQRLAFFIARLCGLTPAAVRTLHPADAGDINEAIAPFVEGGPTTG